MTLEHNDYITALRIGLENEGWKLDDKCLDEVRAELAEVPDGELCTLYHCAVHPFAIGETAATMTDDEDLLEALGCAAFHFGIEIGRNLAYLESIKGMALGNA